MNKNEASSIIVECDRAQDTRHVTMRDGVESGCVLSPCEKFRYVLWRTWDEAKPKWMFILLNPSTATHEEDDATISRQITRAKRHGAGGIVVVNTGAIRETDSDAACASPDPIGPNNAYWVKKMIPECDKHICGWGAKAARFGGDTLVRAIFRETETPLYALKLNADGSPQHPLYIGYDQPLLDFRV